MKFQQENGRRSKILRMKYPLNIFLQIVHDVEIFTHEVAKIQLLRTKFIILNFRI